MKNTAPDMSDPNQLFDDTSSGPTRHRTQDMSRIGYPSQGLLSEPVSNFAMAYGSSLADHGKEMVDKNVSGNLSPLDPIAYHKSASRISIKMFYVMLPENGVI